VRACEFVCVCVCACVCVFAVQQVHIGRGVRGCSFDLRL